MPLGNLLQKNAESGIGQKHDKDHRFLITRRRTVDGQQEYLLENRAVHEKIIIPRELLDHFRSHLSKIVEKIQGESPSAIDTNIYFNNQDYISIRFAHENHQKIIVKGLIKTSDVPGILSLSIASLPSLLSLLYHRHLDHPSDTFDYIIQYHKLFQFSFIEATDSITSALTLRRDVLTQISPYSPALAAKHANKQKISEEAEETVGANRGVSRENHEGDQPRRFKSKLGHKDGNQDYSINYEDLFENRLQNQRKADTTKQSPRKQKELQSTVFPLPLLTSDIKAFAKTPFRCEMPNEDVIALRENFLRDRESEFFLGFEIMDAVYKHNGKYRTFRFPLYYMRVSIEESGRFIHIHPPSSGEFFLNHLALATLVDSFSLSKAGDPIDKFFENLLCQKIDVEGNLLPIRLRKLLPLPENIFELTRRVLIGEPGENGKGGILQGLKTIGIESDLEAVSLYKSGKSNSPVTRALEKDLEAIHKKAHENQTLFHASLLGQLVTPEMATRQEIKPQSFYERSLCPGVPSKSTVELFNKLNNNNLVLLEGPPGTGKTFTILNLFIHCVNSKKKLLIVSDQIGAIQALVEKIEEYLVGKDFHSIKSKEKLSLWQDAIKVIGEIPTGTPTIRQWLGVLSKSLNIESATERNQEEGIDDLLKGIEIIDKSIDDLKTKIDKIIAGYLGDSNQSRSLTPKYNHPTTVDEIDELIQFLDFEGAGRHAQRPQGKRYLYNRELVYRFTNDREICKSKKTVDAYDSFFLDSEQLETIASSLQQQIGYLTQLITEKPRTQEDFDRIMPQKRSSAIAKCIEKNWDLSFPSTDGEKKLLVRKVASYIKHPQLPIWKQLLTLLKNQNSLLRELSKYPHSKKIINQFNELHLAMHPENYTLQSLCMEIVRYSRDNDQSAPSIQGILRKIKKLQKKRDLLIRQLFECRLTELANGPMTSPTKQKTNAITTIATLLDALKDCKSIDQGKGFALLKELQDKLASSFPIWICRKQAVSFLFPSRQEQFDLVIVDEAGQCRVDDALPLLYRAKKLMVVGDDKQTVLDKNSVVDDYLFKEFHLEEHLLTTQARGIKGGGSNIFSMVKSIKQAGVMLDEHYRCPPDIIRYSNDYVYGSNLKIMQWQHPHIPKAVVVDFKEKGKPSNRPTSGKYKGIEVNLVDRFLEFVQSTIKEIEKTTGSKVNLETDVALCYFLLKNEPYIKDKKPDFLRKVNRGEDILDGAGAALQGKERDYIFYLWDVNRGNFTSFKQGDDPDKRKGELNVLMSRPKKRAFHYLHGKFSELNHEAASITDYLWKTLHRQSHREEKSIFTPRTKKPDAHHRPWQRSSGNLMHAILAHLWEKTENGDDLSQKTEIQYSITVGDPKFRVDLMLISPNLKHRSIAILDLAAFEEEKNRADEIVNYFFQLQRAVPPIEPIFVFLHELADERSESFRRLKHSIKKRD